MPIQPMPQESLGTELVNTWINADYAAQEERVLGNSDYSAMIAEHRLTPNPFEERSYLNAAYPLPPQEARVNYPNWMATSPSPAVPMRMEASEGTAWVAPAMGTPASEANAPRPWTTLGSVTDRMTTTINTFVDSINAAHTSVRQLEITAFTNAEFSTFKNKAARVCDEQLGRSGRANFSLGINALTFLRLEVTTRNQSGQQYSVQQDVDGYTILFGRPVRIVNSVPNGHVELILDSNQRNAMHIYQGQREAVSARSNRSTEVRAV